MKPFSICITSCNRLKYLKALFESIEDLREYAQVVVVDTGSTEPGLVDFVRSQNVDFSQLDGERDWINDEYKAKNKLIEMSKHDVVMFLQDDTQIIATKRAFEQVSDDMEQMDDCYVLDIFGVRKQTMRNTVDLSPKIINGRSYWRRKDRHYITTGIYKREVFESIGEYPTSWEQDKANWGKSEDWYNKKFQENFPEGNIYRTHVPLALAVWNTSGGGYAFIRENKRFGEYLDPEDGSGLYYSKNVQCMEHESYSAVSYTEVAEPLGWSLAKDETGEIKKQNQWEIFENGPFELL